MENVLSKKVLILNADFLPIGVVTMERALILYFTDKARIVKENMEFKVKSGSSSWTCPSVMQLKKYANVKFRKLVPSRTNIFKRDNNSCLYCGSKRSLTLDHVIPRSKGGSNSWTNLATACGPCNHSKGDMSLEEWSKTKHGKELKYTPYKPEMGDWLVKFGKIEEDWKDFLK